MKLHDLHPAPGSHRPARRAGRGEGSGRGKTAGRGTKGQKARAGGNLPAWFEGGQTPLHVRTPKLHGFKNRFRLEYAGVNLGRLASFESGTLVTPDVLQDRRIVARSRSSARPVKILGGGEAPAGITVHAHAFTRAALDKLAAAGSSAQVISWPDDLPVGDTEVPAQPDAADLDADGAAAGSPPRSSPEGEPTESSPGS